MPRRCACVKEKQRAPRQREGEAESSQAACEVT
jgi:hypothetical protein